MAGARKGRNWSAKVTKESDALDLESGVFEGSDPKAIAASLKRSAEHSHATRKSAVALPSSRGRAGAHGFLTPAFSRRSGRNS